MQELISNLMFQELCSTIEALWTEHYGTLCVGINWELFTDVEHLTGLCCCMGVSVLTAVFDRMAKDRRFTRSGVPDLTVWNPQDKTFKVSFYPTALKEYRGIVCFMVNYELQIL